jgi:hypothetical protein
MRHVVTKVRVAVALQIVIRGRERLAMLLGVGLNQSPIS